MLIEKADMLDALLGNFVETDLGDAATEGSITLGYLIGWLDAIRSMVDADEKKHDERKELLEQLKRSCARVNAEGFWDTAENIEKDLAEMETQKDVVEGDDNE